MRRWVLISTILAASMALGQSTPPDAPTPQAGQTQSSQPPGQDAKTKAAGETPASTEAAPAQDQDKAQAKDKKKQTDPNAPDWDGKDTLYEKKSLGQRIKEGLVPCNIQGHEVCNPAARTQKNDPVPNVQGPGPNQKPPRSDDRERSLEQDGESSSRGSIIDLSPPKNDAAEHPNSETNDVTELKKWDPHKSAKDVEVGDFYFSRQNYRAAESRYQEALEYKENNAEAMFKLADTEEKLGNTAEAQKYFALYLKTLPEGPRADEAKKALERLSAPQAAKQ